ncbi:MATE family efflux transporter [Nocardioides sp. Root151]|uniref:MATE family efflux transporter n=1 Tax=Nocardioides sp. Root151 TaxID=1736475 RepID=UPI000703A7D0|nr:MATE family efflux transporter [Nocardioides sp. Root151]KQZ68908.1 MATE family efflux transporter [Nocardioides sp. Root151]
MSTRAPDRSVDREILKLAIPAFLALVAEPLFLLADAAIVGHLGTPELAGLGIAGAVLQTAVGLCVFLAYGTTASVARQLGAGNLRAAISQGIDGIWLAVIIGVVTTVAGILATDWLVGLFGANGTVADHASDYLRIGFLGTTPLLVILAATGVLRGMLDTRTPLIAAVLGNLLNIVLNFALVYGVGPVPALGLKGSALGSVIAQVFMAGLLLAVVLRGARREGASLRPDLPGIRTAAHAAVALVVRTLTLRAALLVTTYAAVQAGGDTPIATHQLAMTIWSFLAFVLDSIAIAAQALTGRYLGAGDRAGTRAITRRMVQWGIASGVVTGLGLAALSPVMGHLFTSDRAVIEQLVPVLLIAAVAQPIAGYVFVLDGVLIGAGDGAYLAWGGLAVLIVYTPLALLADDLVWLWVAFGFGFMLGRAVVLGLRARGEKWMVLGAT